MKLADDIVRLSEGGSSAAGEQSKFVCDVKTGEGKIESVIVKFSPNEKSLLAQRRSDLLISEYIAHQLMTKWGYQSVESQIYFGENRTFLELARFDRKGERGRRGVISLNALNLEFVGSAGGSWTEVCRELEKLEWIDGSVLQSVQQMELFGELIGNNDMHRGNL